MVHVFIDACVNGDKSEAKSMVERDPGLHNKQGRLGVTGPMWAVIFKQHSICRWLLSLPGLDTNLRDGGNWTALHYACQFDTPLDFVIALVRLSSWETINMKTSMGETALDIAVQSNNTSAALYLTWLGVGCTEENRKYSEVTLHCRPE